MDIQAKLYARTLEDNIKRDSYFKDFQIMPYRFIVINKTSLCPLVWEFESTFKQGEILTGNNNQIVLRDYCDIGKELSKYLKEQSKTPEGIILNDKNSLEEWMRKL